MKTAKQRQKYYMTKNGLTLVEVIFSISMFAMFMSVFVSLAEFTSNFINKSNTTLQGSEGALIDHQLIQSSFDRLANFLSQPGVTYNEINQMLDCLDEFLLYLQEQHFLPRQVESYFSETPQPFIISP